MHIKIFLVAILLLLFPKQTYADEKFSVDANVEYKVSEKGSSAVTHTVTIKNITSYEYAKSYILELSNMNPQNLKAYEEGSPIPTQINKTDTVYRIDLNFNKPVAGKGKSKTFVVTYEEDGLAQLNGDVWEVSVPKLINKYDSYKINLSVPDIFGEEALISPDPLEKNEIQQRLIYTFEGKDLEKSGVYAVFGKFQVFSLKLKYHLKNSLDKKTVSSIAIPPDTSTQRMFYTNVFPVPKHIETDEDGNWLFYYDVLPRSVLKISVEGYAQVFTNPVKHLTPYPSTILENLSPQEYWESDDPAIKEIAMHLKTPEAIYDFVTQNLTYNYDRVKPDVERLGAKNVLSATNEAICTEFTDLFIALSRAAGIPAREINGFAYSDNPKLQPLSLVSDVLHSWPEYWDDTRQNWIPVDPTWESTSNIDYFSKFDLKHIAFVIHGKNSTLPLPAGSYKSDNMSKDVFVEFSTLPVNNTATTEISHEIKGNYNPFSKKLIINIKNTGSSARYDLSPKIFYEDNQIIKENISVLPPFGTYSLQMDIPLGLFALKTPNIVSVYADHSQKEILLNKTAFATQQLLSFLSFLLIILIYFGIKTKKINIHRINDKLKTLFKNAPKS